MSVAVSEEHRFGSVWFKFNRGITERQVRLRWADESFSILLLYISSAAAQDIDTVATVNRQASLTLFEASIQKYCGSRHTYQYGKTKKHYF